MAISSFSEGPRPPALTNRASSSARAINEVASTRPASARGGEEEGIVDEDHRHPAADSMRGRDSVSKRIARVRGKIDRAQN